MSYRSDDAIASALTRYRISATVVGVALIVLFFIGIPLQYGFGHKGVDAILGIVHGVVFFPIYLIISFDLAFRMRWSILATLSVLVAGIVPIGSFYVESRVRKNVQALLALHAEPAPA